MKHALLVLDMLNDFVTGKLKCDRAQPIIPKLRELAAAARAGGVPVFYLNDAHFEGDFELSVWGAHAMEGEDAAKVIPELEPKKGDYVIPKRTYSGFFETPLDSLLRANKVDTVVVTGLHTNICDRHTSADAFFRGYKVVIVSDACQAFSDKDHEEGLAYIKANYGARVATVDELCSEWGKK